MFLKFMDGLWYNLKNPLPEYNEQPSSPKDKGWCQKIFIVDFDQNGFDDLVCSSHAPAGKYQEWRPPVIMFYEGSFRRHHGIIRVHGATSINGSKNI